MRRMHTLVAVIGSLALQATMMQQVFAADEKLNREKMLKCINAEMQKENTARKGKARHLTDAQLKKLEKIIDAEIMKEPTKKRTESEEKKIFKEIEDAAKKELPEVPTENIDKIIIELKDKAIHCATFK